MKTLMSIIEDLKKEKQQYEEWAENPPNWGGAEDPSWVYADKARMLQSTIEKLEAAVD